MENPRTTLQEYLLHLEAWGKSGLSKNEYCQQQGLKYHQFLYWIRRWKQESQPDKFYSIKVLGQKPGELPGSPAGRFATVTLMNRCTIEFHQSVPASYIGEIAQSCI